MSVTSFVRQLVQRVADYVSPPGHDLCAPRELERSIHRERSRADRSGGQFAVVSFFPNHGRSDRRTLLPLVDHLKRRSRSVDELGWTQENQLCLVLADCSPKAASQLAVASCREFSSARLTLAFTLYHYAANTGTGNESKPPTYTATQPHVPSEIDPTRLVRHEREFDCQPPEHAERSEPVGLNKSRTCEPALAMEVLFEQKLPRWKRALDVLASGTALIVLAPLLAAIALAVRLSSPGPIFFQQLRTGRGGRPFTMYKFRSMVPDAELQKRKLLALNEQDGPAFKMENDPRVTRVGRILRAFSMDELPPGDPGGGSSNRR